MSYYQILGLIFRSLIIIIPAYLILLKRNSILYSSVGMLLCIGATINYDFRLFSISLMQILLVIISFIGMNKQCHIIDIQDNNYKRIKKYTIIFIVYLSSVTIIGYLFKYDYKLIGNVIQNELRPIVQMSQLAFTYIAFLLCFRLKPDSSLKLIQVFHKTLIVFAIIGITQSIVYYLINFDIFPMRKDFVSSVYGLSVIGENGYLRSTAGLGEPKQFAKFMAIGFAINLLSYELFGHKKVKWINIVIFLTAIFFSSSTTGYLIALVAFIIALIKKTKRHIIYFIPLILALIFIVPLVFNLDVVDKKIDDAINNGEVPGLENSDTATVLWLINEPGYLLTGTGIANTVAYANKYAPITSLFINKYPYTLRRGIIKLLAEGGIIAFLIQTNIFFHMYKQIKSDNRIKYTVIFIIIMYMLLTCESIIEVEMILLALLYNVSNNKHNLKGENEHPTN